MAVDLQELLLGSQALTLDAIGKNYGETMDLLNKASVKKYDEVDPLQAAAIKELTKSGMAVDLNSIRPPALQPAIG